MSIIERLASRFRRETVSLELDDIQALILRSRPEPYVGVHAMLPMAPRSSRLRHVGAQT